MVLLTFLVLCSVADAFYAKLKERAQSINIGDPLQPGCRMGPIVSASQYERVRGYVQVRSGNCSSTVNACQEYRCFVTIAGKQWCLKHAGQPGDV
jgi:acyl-CoA reductase-like NAD-dependent aldehyde dehydrogenase